jgi:hypothetical protein
VKLKKTLKPSRLGKKTPKNPKKPKKPKKTQKNPLGWVFLKNPGFFQPWEIQVFSNFLAFLHLERTSAGSGSVQIIQDLNPEG